MVRISRVSGRVTLTIAVFTIAVLSLPGCGKEGGGSREGETIAYGLDFTEESSAEGPHDHALVILQSEVDDGSRIDRRTEPTTLHFHDVTIDKMKLEDFSNNLNIMGETELANEGLSHRHLWSLGGTPISAQ